MLTYTFSRREKVLIAVFTALLVAVGWYQLVYVTTTNQLMVLETELEEVESDIKASQTKLAKKKEMQNAIEQRRAAGTKPKPMPEYDNLKPLMSELDGIMAQASSYSLTFDSIDTESSEYVHRGVSMQFGCSSFKAADELVRTIADGTYPCIIDMVKIATTNKDALLVNKETTPNVVVNLHVVFFERPQSSMH